MTKIHNSDIGIFKDKWEKVSGELIRSENDTPLDVLLGGVFGEFKPLKIVLGKNALDKDAIDKLSENYEVILNLNNELPDMDEIIALCERADIGITKIDGLIIDTGSLVLTGNDSSDRLCSSLPPVHIGIAINAKRFRDLAEFTEQIASDYSYTLITGPSRTADIEKNLVLGAHGPHRVIVIL